MTASTSTLATDTGLPAGTPPGAPKKRGRKWLRAILLLFVFAILMLAGLIAWMVSTESGLRFGLYQVPGWFGVNISSKTLSGTLIDGFNGDEWRIETEGSDIDISSLTLAWQPKELWQKKLHIRRLAAGDIHIQSKPTPPKETTPSQAPQSVSLPVEVALDSLEVGRITSGKAKSEVLRHARLNYVYDHKQHRIRVGSIQTPWSDSSGLLTLDTAAPFKLGGDIAGSGALNDIAVDGTFKLSGELQNIQLNSNLAGQGVKLTADTQIHPFGNTLDKIIGHVAIKGNGLNPQAFIASAPKADLDFDATVVPAATSGLSLEGSIDLANHQAAAADQGGIPVRSLLADFTVDENGVLKILEADAALLKKGRISFSGSTDTAKQTLNLDTESHDIVLGDVLAQEYPDALNGKIQLRGSYSDPQALWNFTFGKTVSNGEVLLSTDTASGQQTVNLKRAQILPENGGETQAAGTLELFKDQALNLNLTSKNFNPAKIHSSMPEGSVNGDIKLTGALGKQLFNGKMQFGQSTLSGVSLRGNADIEYDKDHLSRAITDIALGSNIIKTSGSFGKQGDRLNLNINAPDIARFGFGMSGLLVAQGTLAGSVKQLEANLNGRAERLNISKALQINHLTFNLQGSPDLSKPLNLQAEGRQIIIPGQETPTRIDAVNLAVNGTGRRQSIRGSGSMAFDGKPYRFNLAADGGLNERNQWQGTVSAFDISGAFNLHLQNSLNLEAGAERVSLSAARWAAMGGSLNLERFVWDKKQGITTKGRADNLHMTELHNFYKPAVEHNMVLAGDWDIAYTQNMSGYLNVQRQSGDIILDYRKQALGLSALSLQTRFQNGRIDNQIKGTTRYGNIDGNVVISQNFGNAITQAPVNGRIRLNAPDLEAFKNLMPIGQILKGRLIGDAVISGRLGDPQLNGTLTGDNLYYRNHAQGVILDNGVLRSRLQGRRWIIDNLTFHRGGSATLTGDIGLVGTSPDVNVSAVFNKYQMLDKPNRRLTLSGNARMLYTDATGITLTGTLKADEGRFGFQDSSMPTLSDDVVVIGEEQKEKTAATPISLNLALDLNDNFRFSGEGLDVLLGGTLNITAQPGRDVQGVGTVRVVKGKYKAYGQDLNIDKGTISFVGPLDDPNLNIRATRNLSPVGAGVEVLGSLNNPRVSLVADEAMSEKDKLSWLILNRASSGNDSDEAALATAASAWLAGKVNDRIGLVDNFGLTSQRTRNAQTGELNPAEQVLTFGKQLTSELYLGYEYGINSADQSVKLVYQLTRSIQAIGRVGSQSWGGEMKYIIRFD
ncbi:MAG: translocation/assembly module TamB domain-containing protein [Neisseria sp.]|uniref:translocation/assembly module TamB domain-containing protein n=1 Tax=Neisseria sp. TaxID=192066 RepID=UPI0026DCF3D2|nr:translocation/assembly module TamB domain-containing protein [Neisseria sp.]MDO4248856.1 translocation/assembly module TamB domain-containing protein [Neisseria sp.]